MKSPINFKLEQLDSLKKQFNSGSDLYEVNRLLRLADSLITLDPVSVTQKTVPTDAPTINHYVSVAPYWWPDKAAEDGKPYIWQDGIRNPVADEYDRPRLSTLRSRLIHLGMAYHITEDERYASNAADQLKTWFITPETKMHPNLQYAQGIPGVVTGRPIGIIDGIEFITILDAYFLIRKSPSWKEIDDHKLFVWYSDFLSWMANSYFGKVESQANNNHGSWYDAQVSTYSKVVNDLSVLDTVLTLLPGKRLNPHINSDGIQIREVNRTLSLHYHVFNLDALTISANIGEVFGYEIWNYARHGNSDILLAIDYLIPYLLNEKPWPRNQILGYNPCRAIPVLSRAANHTGNTNYNSVISLIKNNNSCSIREHLLY